MGSRKHKMNKKLKEELQKEYEELPITLQIMHELKMSAQRWFVIAMAELIVIILILVMVFVVPTDEYSTVTQTLEDIQDTSVTQTVGD